MAHITSHRTSAERYTGLRLLSAIFTVLGALLAWSNSAPARSRWDRTPGRSFDPECRPRSRAASVNTDGPEQAQRFVDSWRGQAGA
jgi:hypothetical protein